MMALNDHMSNWCRLRKFATLQGLMHA